MPEKFYWNGLPAVVKVVTYKVGVQEQKTWWANMYEGERRQGLQVTQGDSSFIIDNQYGDGWYKVTDGRGSPSCGHLSVHNPQDVREVRPGQVNKVYNKDGLNAMQQEHQDWIAQHHPKVFEQLTAMQKAFNESQRGGIKDGPV